MKRSLSLLLVLVLCLCLLPASALADTASGTYNQSDARSMLSMINDFRTGSNAWYWNADNRTKTVFNTSGGKYLGKMTYDYNLEQIAMQRAAELAVSFSHTRPDGTSCFTCTYNGTKTWGENIALGWGVDFTSDLAFELWREDDYDYGGQGHRRNMLNADFQAIGIACFESEGTKYWVQEFGYTNSGSSASSSGGSSSGSSSGSSTSKTTYTAGWKQSGGKWWYQNSDGSYPANRWQQIGGKWYHFDANGYMQTGWLTVSGSRYYLKSSGAMATGWVKDGGVWYYLNSSGRMVTGWQKIGSTWYYFKSTGAMAASEWISGYWLGSGGAWTYQPKGSWHNSSKGWWYGDTSGWYAKNGTVRIDGTDYTFNAAGYWVK